MFVIVYNNNVILGPMRWNRYRFENEIKEECEFEVSLQDRNDDLQPVIVSDDIKILPILGTDNPPYNPKIEILHGPFWEFTDTHAVYSYEPQKMPLESAKNLLKEEVAAERWKKETSGITVTIGGQDYQFKTDRETRALLKNAVDHLDGMTWKQDRENWIQMTSEDTQSVMNAVISHVQSCFDWEYNKLQEINSCQTLEELNSIVVQEPEEK